MMTTETTGNTPVPRPRVLLGAAAGALVAGLVLVLVAALTGGRDAAYGSAVGTVVVLGVFATGSFAVDMVAGVLPSASLLVAMLTYTLQVVVLGLVFVALSGSGLLDDTIDGTWLGCTIIAGTFAWLACQVVLTMRLRIPAFDLTGPTSDHPEQGGER